MLSSDEKQFYIKHLLLDKIGEAGQQKLRKAKVLIVGAGGLGCPVASYLTGAGIGIIGIIDGDRIDLSNLQRQVLYSYDEVGKFKAHTAALKLKRNNPFIEFKVYNENLNVRNALKIISAFDIIVDATDNFPTRYLINDACVLLNKPFVFASIDKYQGQLSVFNFSEAKGKTGPTYRCVFPNPPAPATAPNCSESGVLGVLPGLLGILQANEVIKIVSCTGNILAGKMLVADLLKMTFYTIKIMRAENATQDVINLRENPTEFVYEHFCTSNTPRVPNIYPDEIESLHDLQFIDVRDKNSMGGINNAIKIPASQIKDHLELFSSDKKMVLYCDYGITSQKAVYELRLLGKENVFNLQGGLHRWNTEKNSKRVV